MGMRLKGIIQQLKIHYITEAGTAWNIKKDAKQSDISQWFFFLYAIWGKYKFSSSWPFLSQFSFQNFHSPTKFSTFFDERMISSFSLELLLFIFWMLMF